MAVFIRQIDITEANAIMEQLAVLWRVRWTRMHPMCHYNYACWPVENDSVRIVLDITRRKDSMDQLNRWGGVFYQETQWLEAKRSVDGNPGTVFVFAPKCQGMQWAMATTRFEHDGRQKANPAGRHDKNSLDWCVKLKQVRFDIASERRPWERLKQSDLF
jgi:hypothetical protein